VKTCFLCRGAVEVGRVDYMANRAGRYALVKNLPVERCVQCGEVYLDADASRQVDAALANAATAEERLDVPVVYCR